MTQATDTDIREVRDLILALDKKLDAQDKKFDVFAAKTEEKLSSIDQRLERLEKRVDTQDARLWGFLGLIVTALLGLLAKLAFFPGSRA
jgi:uncharacterized protein YpuA (DUF1002 family)